VAEVGSDCPAFDRLLGSRLLVGNAELRFPLVGAFRGGYDYGFLPLDVFLFADSGVACNSQVNPSFADGSRDFVSSVGVGVRANAFGYFVLELAAIRPLDRPGRGWVFGFNLAPAF
jgi:outer membrane protein assembly factor BamA